MTKKNANTETTQEETKVKEVLINALVLESHACEIAGKRMNLVKGAKVQLTPFQFKILSNPNLTVKIIQAV